MYTVTFTVAPPGPVGGIGHSRLQNANHLRATSCASRCCSKADLDNWAIQSA